MNSELKAKELIEKFEHEPNAVKGEGLSLWAVYNKESAKACALICVEEIIKQLDELNARVSAMLNPVIEFWEQVKQHLK